MKVQQNKPNWWNLVFGLILCACGVWAFIAGLLTPNNWQILLGLSLFYSGQLLGSRYITGLALYEKYDLYLKVAVSLSEAEDGCER